MIGASADGSPGSLMEAIMVAVRDAMNGSTAPPIMFRVCCAA